MMDTVDGQSTSLAARDSKPTRGVLSPNGMSKQSSVASSAATATSTATATTPLGKPSQAKKLIIKNFVKPHLPDNYLDSTWQRLKAAVIAIQTSAPISTPLEDLYANVENLCSHNYAPEVYRLLEQICIEHVKSNIHQFDADMDSFMFLKSLDSCWQNHCRQMVRKIASFII